MVYLVRVVLFLPRHGRGRGALPLTPARMAEAEGAFDPQTWIRYLVGLKYTPQESFQLVPLFAQSPFTSPQALAGATKEQLSFVPKKLQGKVRALPQAAAGCAAFPSWRRPAGGR